jgi:hypothetical protein
VLVAPEALASSAADEVLDARASLRSLASSAVCVQLVQPGQNGVWSCTNRTVGATPSSSSKAVEFEQLSTRIASVRRAAAWVAT